MVVGLVLLAGLLIWGFRSGTRTPYAAAGGLVVAAIIGVVVGPDAPGSSQHATGTASIGTADNATAFWSGSVECDWFKDEGKLERLRGFDLTVTDRDLAAALDLDVGAHVVALQLSQTLQGGGLGVGESINDYSGAGAQLTLKNLQNGGRSGAAVTPDGAVVVSWSCTNGP